MKKMKEKYYRGWIVIFSMFYFFVHIELFNQDIKSVVLYVILLFFYNYQVRRRIEGTYNLKVLFDSLLILKYSLYFIVAFGMIIDLLTTIKLEDKYTLISFFVILISLLEGITGFRNMKNPN